MFKITAEQLRKINKKDMEESKKLIEELTPKIVESLESSLSFVGFGDITEYNFNLDRYILECSQGGVPMIIDTHRMELLEVICDSLQLNGFDVQWGQGNKLLISWE